MTPYDDTGWTLPEGFGVQAFRASDSTVLDVPVEKVTGVIRAPGGIVGTGCALRHQQHRRQSARDAAVSPQGRRHASGRRAVRGGRASLQSRDLHPARRRGGHARPDRNRSRAEDATAWHRCRRSRSIRCAPRAWRSSTPGRSTQTEGWWRIAFDQLKIPYDYISPQDIAGTPDLRARWDVLIFPPSGGTALSVIEGMPMWGHDPVPWKVSPDTPNLGTLAQTDDIRPGMTWQGLITLQNFVRQGGVFLAATTSTELPLIVRDDARCVGESNSRQLPLSRIRCCGRVCRTRRARWPTASPTTSPSSATTARASA